MEGLALAETLQRLQFLQTFGGERWEGSLLETERLSIRCYNELFQWKRLFGWRLFEYFRPVIRESNREFTHFSSAWPNHSTLVFKILIHLRRENSSFC